MASICTGIDVALLSTSTPINHSVTITTTVAFPFKISTLVLIVLCVPIAVVVVVVHWRRRGGGGGTWSVYLGSPHISFFIFCPLINFTNESN